MDGKLFAQILSISSKKPLILQPVGILGPKSFLLPDSFQQKELLARGRDLSQRGSVGRRVHKSDLALMPAACN